MSLPVRVFARSLHKLRRMRSLEGASLRRYCGMNRLRAKSRKIFDLKELIGKKIRTKDLTSSSVSQGIGRRISLNWSAVNGPLKPGSGLGWVARLIPSRSTRWGARDYLICRVFANGGREVS